MVPESEWAENGIGGLSARIFIYPISGKKVKIHLVVYPESPENLGQANDLANSAGYPGICVYRTEARLGLERGSEERWGCPLLPCLVGKPPIGESSKPRNEAMLVAVFSLMRGTVNPELKSNYGTLRSRWNELSKEGASLKNLNPEYYWPEPPSTTSTSKKLLSFKKSLF